MHVKAMIVDGMWSVIGSANFDNRSFELNDESHVCDRGSRNLAADLTRDFEADLKHSKQILPEEWRQRGLLARRAKRFGGCSGELF